MTDQIGSVDSQQRNFEKRLSGTESIVTELLQEDSKKVSDSLLESQAINLKRHEDLSKNTDELASTADSGSKLNKSREVSNGEKFAKQISTLEEHVDKELDCLTSCLDGSGDSFLKNELSNVREKLDRMVSLVSFPLKQS